jgi:FixJ family two-component response regulator
MEAAPTVFVVDDDLSIREAVVSLLRSVGLAVVAFASPQEFLRSPSPDGPCCLILDVRLPGLSGLDLQKELSLRHRNLPVIFMTAHGDIPMTVSAMKAGAVEFLTKPFRDQDLLDAVQTGIGRDRDRRRRDASVAEVRSRYETLTVRERETLRLVVSGQLNKQVAATLGISEITVKVHRGNVMRKMNASTFVDLLRMVNQLEIHSSAQ